MPQPLLTLLGTKAGPRTTLERGGPAQVVSVGTTTILIDCAVGTTHQLLRAGIDPSEVDAILLTHHHSDHMGGLSAVLTSAWAHGRSTPVDVIGPPPIATMVEAILTLHATDIEVRIRDEGRPDLRDLVRVRTLDEAGSVGKVGQARVSATLVDHPPFDHAFGYRLDAAGRSVVISGDTAPSAAVVDLARGADVLVHEAVNLTWVAGRSGNWDAARMQEHQRRSHTPVDEVGRVARDAEVGCLVLSHLAPSSTRFTDADWRSAVGDTFEGPVIIGHDLMALPI